MIYREDRRHGEGQGRSRREEPPRRRSGFLGEPAERAGEEDPSLNQPMGKAREGKIEQAEGGVFGEILAALKDGSTPSGIGLR